MRWQPGVVYWGSDEAGTSEKGEVKRKEDRVRLVIRGK